MIPEKEQCLMDLAIQYSGDAGAILAIALANGISMTASVLPGTVLEEAVVLNTPVYNYFKDNGYVPATDSVSCPGGIGCWAIGIDFIVI